MIFSKEKWSNADEMMPFISVSRSLEFQTVEAPLRNAFEKFIRPLLGESMTEDLISYYQSTSPTPVESRLLFLAKMANARLAFWDNYDEMQMLIGGSGTLRQESEDSKTPYKYQEQALKRSWKEKGFNALDALLQYLEEQKAVFTDFASSPYYTENKKEIVRNAAEIDRYYFINGSRLIYLRLKQHMQNISIGMIKARIGATIYDDFISDIATDNPAEKHKKLREALIPVVVFYSLARLVKETGSITEKGLFFDSLSGSTGDNETVHQPVSDERIIMQANMLEADGIAYWKIAEKLLATEFEYTSNTGTLIPKRNNTDKKSFWA